MAKINSSDNGRTKTAPNKGGYSALDHFGQLKVSHLLIGMLMNPSTEYAKI